MQDQSGVQVVVGVLSSQRGNDYDDAGRYRFELKADCGQRRFNGLARSTDGPVTRFDLEDPAAVARLADPMLALSELAGLVVLDEIQHRPDLFSSLRSWQIAARYVRVFSYWAALHRICCDRDRNP